MTDAEILYTIQHNMNVQKLNHPDSPAAAAARKANRPLFAEAGKRNLKWVETE